MYWVCYQYVILMLLEKEMVLFIIILLDFCIFWILGSFGMKVC